MIVSRIHSLGLTKGVGNESFFGGFVHRFGSRDIDKRGLRGGKGLPQRELLGAGGRGPRVFLGDLRRLWRGSDVRFAGRFGYPLGACVRSTQRLRNAIRAGIRRIRVAIG